MKKEEDRWSSLELKYNDNLICPYCKDEIQVDAEDIINGDEMESMECPNCDKEFIYSCNYEITYNTYGLGKIPKE